MDLNIVMFIGRLVRSPEYKLTPNGHPVCKITLAVNGATDKDTLFIDCTAFEQTANVVNQYAVKGQQVSVVGRLRQDKWTGKDGAPHSKMSVTVNSIQLLSKPQTQTPPQTQNMQNPWEEEAQQYGVLSSPSPFDSVNAKAKTQPMPPAGSMFNDENLPWDNL